MGQLSPSRKDQITVTHLVKRKLGIATIWKRKVRILDIETIMEYKGGNGLKYILEEKANGRN
jgi:hypothetical protein